ncbi:MAG: transporter [Isosphaerales bacterium]
MVHSVVRLVACVSIVAMGTVAHAQSVGSRAPEGSSNAGASQPASPDQAAEETGPARSENAPGSPEPSLLDRLYATLSQQEDPDGPISTDRPTFTPANTVVPPGRLQFESGFTFNSLKTATTRSTLYGLPELAMRYGLMNRVEFRAYWPGQTWEQTQSRPGGPWRTGGGLSDMEVGFKWQLFAGDTKRKWIPTTALITSITAPTGGTSPFSSESVEAHVNLIYGWALTEKLTLAGSTGYEGLRQRPAAGSVERTDSSERYHQSLVAFFSATARTTLFYEWYILMSTNAADNRPTHFMDGGLLYRLTPNMQLDLRAGFGLSGRPDDFFTGVGFSVRF